MTVDKANTISSNPRESLIYQPLNKDRHEIRVLELHPGVDDEPLRCDLHVISLLPDCSLQGLRDRFYNIWTKNVQKIKDNDQVLIEDIHRLMTLHDQFATMLSTEEKSFALAALLHKRQYVDVVVRWMRPMQVCLLGVSLFCREDGIESLRILFADRMRTNSIFLDGPKPERAQSSKYEAVSYRWEDPIVRKSIILNGVDFEAPFSAKDVLCHLRKHNERRRVWIDALCINQANPRERAEQVKIMGKVYANAAHTLTWLGRESQHTKLALGLLDELATKSETKSETKSATKLAGSHNVFENWRDVSEDVNEILHDVYAQYEGAGFRFRTLMEDSFSRAWFTRLWVFQEVKLSRECTCYIGNLSLP